MEIPEPLWSRNEAVHIALAPLPDKVHGDPVKLPAAPVEVKLTVPAGVIGVPAVDVSATVAVQVEA